jgi:PadR family transcriptional regulator
VSAVYVEAGGVTVSTRSDLPQGTLYPALHRLENRDLLTAEWKMTDTGREAKFYRLTRKGRTYMEAETRNWQRLTDAIGLILKSAEGGAS